MSEEPVCHIHQCCHCYAVGSVKMFTSLIQLHKRDVYHAHIKVDGL